MSLKKQVLKFCILQFFLLIHATGKAQLQPNFIQLQIENGLQSNSIYNLHVAKNGLLYIAHSKGLSSFDGNSFTNYFNKEKPFTEVTNIMETDNGKIFCKAFNNVWFKTLGDSLRWVAEVLPYSYGFSPSSAYENNLFSLTNDSLHILNSSNNNRTAIALNTSTALVNKQDIKFVGIGNLKGMTTLFILNNNLKISHIANNNGNYHFDNGELFFVKNKAVLDINYYTQDENIQIQPQQSNTSINYITTTDSTIWVCTTKGLYYRNKYNKNEKFKYILAGFDVTDIVKTKEGNYFIATLGQGLLFVPNFNVNKISNLPSNITSIAGFNNELMLGTKENTIFNLNVKNNSYTTQKIEGNGAVKFIHIKDAPIPTIISNNNTIINGVTYPFSFKDYCVVDDNIVLATNAGIYVYQTKKNTHWISNYIIPDRISDNQLKKISFSNEYTSNIKYNPKNDKFYISNYTGLFEMANGCKDYVKLPEPTCVLKDICVWNGELLLASKDRGLLKWNGKEYEAAFPEQQTTGILYKFEIYKNELWILGEDAIFCYKNDALITYNNQVGINAANIKGLYISENEVYANNGNSVIQFFKKIANENNTAASFVLNRVIDVDANKEIAQNATLSYNQNFVSFQFSLIAYANAANTHIAYSINDKDMVHLPSNRREINLDFLKPENYTIEFYVVSNGITPLKPAAKFSFVITPPFYNTWWFYLLSIIGSGALIYFFVRRRIIKERADLALKQSKLLLEKELDKTTLSSIKAQMNPHFIFNALNTIQSYVYMNDKKNASSYISKFSDLTRNILDMSNKDTITVQEEVNALELYLSLEKMRFQDSFNYKITIQPNLAWENIVLPPMLLQPYVENSVKHGLLHKKTNRVLQINFDIENKLLKISIDDNGIGRKKSAELKELNKKHHESFAMNANKKRMDILLQQHKELNLEIIDKVDSNDLAVGTLVIIKLPIKMG
jgi:hypothetical protein